METDELNHLADETSPYLQDHADNPVDWYPWGEEALEKAKQEDKPIFLSIGYSACHWCHVMKRESFKDEETARLMNENFVNIKVDREERPDLDEIYMQAVQSMTGRGGWPMSVFLTPDLKPFYGGTYFPPEPRQGMPAFKEVLQRVRTVYDEKRDDIEENAEDITRNLEQLEDLPVAEDVPGPELVQRTYNQLEDRFDARYGGFGSSPKFPRVMDGQLLARLQGTESEYPRAGEMLSSTLDHMMRGGIYDQIGGGFSRYSTDRQWLVPHFEKMLYDNAQLVDLYTVSYRIFDEPRYRRVVEETLTYVDREMTHPEGAFYSTQDAESEGEEGKYYVWSHEEFMDEAGENASLLADYWGVTEEGNFEGKNILHVEQPPEEFCADRDLDVDDFRTILQDARQRLLEVREQRVKPGRDEKILTDWNGLMAAACARAGFFLNNDEYVTRARRCLKFLHENLRVDDEWQHTYKDGRAHTPAFLDDYAFLIKAHLELFQVSGESRWLERALELYDRAMDQFWDDDGGGFYVTGPRHTDVPVRSRSPQDKAQPSGNSEMALNALKLTGLTGDPDYRSHAGTIFRAFDRYLDKAPTSMTRMMCALFDYHEGGREILVRGTDSEREPFLDRLRRRYLPGAVLFQADGEGGSELTNLLEGREDGPSPAVYVCRRGTCRRPVTEPDQLSSVLEETGDEES